MSEFEAEQVAKRCFFSQLEVFPNDGHEYLLALVGVALHGFEQDVQRPVRVYVEASLENKILQLALLNNMS